jgi:hypothetical protein
MIRLDFDRWAKNYNYHVNHPVALCLDIGGLLEIDHFEVSPRVTDSCPHGRADNFEYDRRHTANVLAFNMMC